MSQISVSDGIALANALAELGLKVWMAAEARRGTNTAGMSIVELIARIQSIRIRNVDDLLAEGASQAKLPKA